MDQSFDGSGIERLTHGDAQAAREFRANLARFARQTESSHVRKLVSEVLKGRRNYREVFRTKEFDELAGGRLANLEEGLAQLTDEERAEVWNLDREPTSDDVLTSLMDGSTPEATEQPSDPGASSAQDDEEDFSQRRYLQ